MDSSLVLSSEEEDTDLEDFFAGGDVVDFRQSLLNHMDAGVVHFSALHPRWLLTSLPSKVIADEGPPFPFIPYLLILRLRETIHQKLNLGSLRQI